jgi:drug/metabolite transporter, DME family
VRAREGVSLSALLVIAGTALFGTVGTARVLGPSIPSPSIAAGRLGAAAVLFLLLAVLLSHFATTRQAFREPWVYLAGAGQAGFQVCFLHAVEQIDVATGTLITIGSTPLLAGLMTRNVTRTWVLATAISVPGLVLLVGADPDRIDPLGMAAALGAALSYSTYIVASRHLVAGGKSGPGVLAAIFTVSGVALTPFLFLTDPGALWTTPGLVTVAYLALVPTVLAYHLFNAGLRGVSASTAATLGLTEPVVAAGLGVAVLGERLGLAGALGAALVLAGLFVLVTRQGEEQ